MKNRRHALERYSHVLPSIQDEAAARVERMLLG